MGALRNILARAFASKTEKVARNEFDGGGSRRRLKSWAPTQNTLNVIMTSQGALLRSRCRDALRNNVHANAAAESLAANLIGTGIKPSSLYRDPNPAPPPVAAPFAPQGDPTQPKKPPPKKPVAAFPPAKPKPAAPDAAPEVPEPAAPEDTEPGLREEIMELWLDWTDQCDADGIADFYGMQTIVSRALIEAGECFVRFRNRLPDDGMDVPLQIQLLESEMCPYHLNRKAENGNYIMNGIELDLRGKRVAYWFYQIHPGDAAIETDPLLDPVRVPAADVLHVFRCTRPGQMRGVPLLTPALTRMFFLDQYDDAELERKRIAAMFAGFITSATPEDIIPIDAEQDDSAPQEGVALSGLEPGTMQTLLPGEDIKFSEPADVGGTYEAYQYRQQLALYAALGIPYSVATSDLRRANYSSLRGSIVEYRRKLEQFQHNVFVFMMCRPIWQRWMDTAVLASALSIDPTEYLADRASYTRAKWIPQRNDWVDPLKDRQAEKLAVDSGFKSRSDVIEAEGSDPEENDLRIAADREREARLGLNFDPAPPPSPFGDSGGDGAEEKDQQKLDAEDAEDKDAEDKGKAA